MAKTKTTNIKKDNGKWAIFTIGFGTAIVLFALKYANLLDASPDIPDLFIYGSFGVGLSGIIEKDVMSKLIELIKAVKG